MPQLGVDSHVSFFRDASFPIRWFILERTIKLLRRLPSALVSRAGRNLSLPVPALLPKPPQTFLASRFCSLFPLRILSLVALVNRNLEPESYLYYTSRFL